MICADQDSKWSYLHALYALVYGSNLWVSVCGLSRKQELENHCSDLTSHNVVKNILHYLIVWVINNSLIYLTLFFISFLQTTVDFHNKPTEQGSGSARLWPDCLVLQLPDYYTYEWKLSPL